MTQTKLKPCPIPWCGGEAELCFPEPIGDSRGSVMCMACYFAGPEHAHWRDATTQWNHRPTEQALIEALQEMVKQCENCCGDGTTIDLSSGEPKYIECERCKPARQALEKAGA